MRAQLFPVLIFTLLGSVTGCGVDENVQPTGASGSAGTGNDAGYNPQINPADFVTGITNRFMPLKPGMVLTYDEDGTQTVVVTVTSQTKVVMGVTCVVVHDFVSLTSDGSIIEDTLDYYAQDKTGNVWYFGEATTEYGEDAASTAGSWEAGVDGALPGVMMWANPVIGEPYRQEYYAGQAEDMGQVIELNVSTTVPFGSYTGCIKTRDFTPLEPTIEENKWYCAGVGSVREEQTKGAASVEVLTTAVGLP